MREREDRDDDQPAGEPDDQADEPAWTEEIRRLRRERGDRLKDLFDAFDREEEAPPE